MPLFWYTFSACSRFPSVLYSSTSVLSVPLSDRYSLNVLVEGLGYTSAIFSLPVTNPEGRPGCRELACAVNSLSLLLSDTASLPHTALELYARSNRGNSKLSCQSRSAMEGAGLPWKQTVFVEKLVSPGGARMLPC